MVSATHSNTISEEFQSKFNNRSASTKALSSVFQTLLQSSWIIRYQRVAVDTCRMKYRGIKRRQIESKNNWIEHTKEDEIVNFIKLICASKGDTQWRFCSICNYSSHAAHIRIHPGNPFFAICLNEKQKFNFAVLSSFNRFPFVCATTKNEISAFPFSILLAIALLYLFSIKSKSWCCDWLSSAMMGEKEGGLWKQHIDGRIEKGLGFGFVLSSTCYPPRLSIGEMCVRHCRGRGCNNSHGMIDTMAIEWGGKSIVNYFWAFCIP